MEDPYYSLEVFSRAVDALTTGEGDIKPRLGEAAKEFYTILRVEQLPKELQHKYKELLQELSEKEGGFPETVANMRKQRASSIAKKIIEIEGTLQEICYRESMNDK